MRVGELLLLALVCAFQGRTCRDGTIGVTLLRCLFANTDNTIMTTQSLPGCDTRAVSHGDNGLACKQLFTCECGEGCRRVGDRGIPFDSQG
jgi:hypothetical protein